MLAVVLVAVEPPEDVDWSLVLAIGAVTIGLFPIQAAGEECVFRGHLPQAIGVVLRSSWPPAILVSALFGLVHDKHRRPWALGVPRSVRVRDRRRHAAIAMHAAGNVVGLTRTAVDGELVGFLLGSEDHAEAWE